MGLSGSVRDKEATLAHTTDFDKKGQGKGNGACCTPIELGISCGCVIYCRANTTDRCIIASASNLHGATGLGMGQAGTSALGREEALQAGWLLLRL